MILIRTDANEQIGIGHLMRCLSIAQSFINKDREVLFITADDMGKTIIEHNGFKSCCLNTPWYDMESEIPILRKILNEYTLDMIIVDSYYVSVEYLQALSRMGETVYIDDINKRRWPVNTVINYNLLSSEYDYSCYDNTDTKLILGHIYTPLRQEFRDLPLHDIKSVTDILISAGGADPENISERIMKEICPDMNEIRFHFIIGGLNPFVDNYRFLETRFNNIILHINEKRIAELMMSCDMAVSAAGSTLYELCACGTPTITYVLADNQLLAAEEFEMRGIMLNAGDCRPDNDFINSLKGLLSFMISDINMREIMSGKMRKLIDGKGADRLVDELLAG